MGCDAERKKNKDVLRFQEPVGQWFPDCAPRIPGDPWIHFCNGYFEVYFFFRIKE